MIADLKPYPAYKNSSVAWLGEVPEHWDLERGKWLFRKMNRPVQLSDEVVTCFRDGMVTLRKNRRLRGFTESLQEIGYQGVRRGDLVIHAMDAFAGAVGVSDAYGKCTPVYAVCEPRVELNPSFYANVVREMARSQWIAALAKGIRERSTDFRFDGFAAQILPVPPIAEQDGVARFLDHADRRIRCYIRAKQKLIKLLEEERQAIIQRTVTRGLNPDVRLKPSGLEWLGDVPEHWEVRRLRTLIDRIDQGVSPQAEAGLAENGAWGVLKAGCVNRGIFRETEHKRLPDGFRFDPALAVRVGDVLVSRASGSPALVGSVARVGSLTYRLMLSDKTFRLVLKDERLAPFMTTAMNTLSWRHQVERAISGAEGLANNLPLSALKNFVLAVPSPEEAQAIARALEASMDDAVRALLATRREISLLEEYRTRLITDVVTGKLDVREAAARLPSAEVTDEMPDADLMADEGTEPEAEDRDAALAGAEF